jgi:AraC-like DNA-binding protein
VSVAAYALQLSAFWLLNVGGGGLFWLFAVTLFEDRKLSLAMFAPAILLIAIGIAGVAVQPPAARFIWMVHNLVEAGLAAHVLLVIYRSWRGDLVEARRRVRGPFMSVAALYIIALSGLEIASALGFQPTWRSLVEAASLAVVCVAGAGIFLDPRTALFGAAGAAPAAKDAFDPADRMTLKRLKEVMNSDEIWRREGLTIGALADAVGAPEHRLRKLINDRLGHRNFAAFINARRIEAAKRALADRSAGRATVASIAYALGFASLGPFNRAFKDETGLTPSQWRSQALAETSPIPENTP